MTPIRVLLAATLLAASLAASAQKPEFQKVRLVVRSDADRAAAARHGEVVDDYGSFVIVRLPLPAIEKAHAEGLQFEVVEENVGIGRFRFDPERESPSLPASLADHEDGPEPRYYIVQFRGPIRDEWAANVRAAGIETIQYVPDNALLVRATPSQLARASRGPEVRWSGLYHPAYKLADDLEWLLGKPVKRTQADRQRYRIAVFRSGDLKATVAAIEALGGKVDEVEDVHSLYFRALRVELETAKLADVVSLRDVARVETWHPRVRTDERTNQVIAGNYFGTTVPSPGFASFLVNRGVDGSGITVGLGDDGIDVTETHVAGRVTDDTAIRHGAQAGAEGHGHHDAGIIAGFCTHGDQNGFLYGSGVAPQANLINIPLLRAGYSASDAQSQADVVETTAANGQRGTVSSNSWSYEGLHPGYGTDEAIWDALVLDASSTMPGQQPLAIVFAAGNDGPAASSLTSPIPAKNLVVVGASGNYRPGMTDCNNAGSDIDAVACFSSRGPTTDGRIKPDVLAPGVWVASARAGADALWGNIDAGHRWCGGTSQACPHVAGATALIQQWYRSRTGVLPAPALSKAMLINGAVDPSTTANGAIPNNIEGWGRVNLTNTLSSAPAIFHNEQYVISTPGETYTVTGSVANGSNPFRVTLVWSDPPAAAGANPALVNDLDLEVVIGGQTYRGNVLTNGLSTTGGTADHRNNVESVYLAGVSGAFTITIRATSLGGDGAPGVGDSTDQRFALVVANGTTCPSPLAPTPAAAANGSNRIDVTWNAMPGATSYKVLRATTSGGPYTQVGTPTASPFADTTVTAFTTYFYVVRAVGSSCESDNSSQASATATGTLAAPLSLTATIAGPTSVSLAWQSVAGAAGYRIYRSNNNTAYAVVGSGSATTFTDATATSTAAYVYRVRAFNGATESADSNKALATLVVFTDPALVAGMAMKAVHFTQLRTAVNAVRTLAGSGAFAFTDPVLTSLPIRQIHLTELRTVLDAARLALGLPAVTYGVADVIRAAHVTELRAAAGAYFPPAPANVQLLQNPGFEAGAVNWVATPDVVGATGLARSGSNAASLNGYGTTHVDTLHQDVTIPSAATAATLSFWLRIDSDEGPTTTVYDTLTVQLTTTGGAHIATLATYSNVQAAGAYVQRTFDLLPYKGQTLRLRFVGSEDFSLATSFVIDDTALNVTQ